MPNNTSSHRWLDSVVPAALVLISLLAMALFMVPRVDVPPADETPIPVPPGPSLATDVDASAVPAAGRWHRYRPHLLDDSLTEEQLTAMLELEAIGYLAGSVGAKQETGVVFHDSARARQGLNFYTSGHGPEAVLMDMDGGVLHRWRREFWDIWPDYPTDRDDMNTSFWRRAHLYQDGSILVIFEGLGIVKLDASSNVVWANPNGAHHDLEVQPDGAIYVLTRKSRIAPSVNATLPILEDFITVLDPNGVELRSVSLLEAFENSEAHRHILTESRVRHGDIFHTNTLSVMDGSISGRAPAFARGTVLVAIPIQNAIALVDMDTPQVVWTQRQNWRFLHEPRITDTGTLLLFDNRGQGDRSTIYEYDPATMETLWKYDGTEEKPFYSHTCGAVWRLPNGNTLVTESDEGRAFELAPNNDIVWEYINPHRAGDEGQYVATLFEVFRYPPDFPVDWASGAE